MTVAVAQQGYSGCTERGAGLAQFVLALAEQVGAVFIDRGCFAVGVAENVHAGAGCGQLADERAEAERLIVGMGDHDQRPLPGRQQSASGG